MGCVIGVGMCDVNCQWQMVVASVAKVVGRRALNQMAQGSNSALANF